MPADRECRRTARECKIYCPCDAVNDDLIKADSGVTYRDFKTRLEDAAKVAAKEREVLQRTFRGRMKLRIVRWKNWKHRNWYRDYMRDLEHHRQNVERLAAAYRPTEKDQ